MVRRNWTRVELIVAFNLYCKIPFGRIHNRNPEIISLATLIGRSPSALSWKLANFARLDPSLQARGIKGASHGSEVEREIWEEFHNDWSELSFQSEELIAKLSGTVNIREIDQELDFFPSGTDRITMTRTRVNQDFFRKMILASYNSKCCITGLAVPDLLVASHIVPWAIDSKHRVNPRNGLCLNAFHDRAFDKGLLTLTTEFKVKVSPKIREIQDAEALNDFLFRFDNQKIIVPDKFMPSTDFIEYHNREVFQ